MSKRDLKKLSLQFHQMGQPIQNCRRLTTAAGGVFSVSYRSHTLCSYMDSSFWQSQFYVEYPTLLSILHRRNKMSNFILVCSCETLKNRKIALCGWMHKNRINKRKSTSCRKFFLSLIWFCLYKVSCISCILGLFTVFALHAWRATGKNIENEFCFHPEWKRSFEMRHLQILNRPNSEFLVRFFIPHYPHDLSGMSDFGIWWKLSWELFFLSGMLE